MDFAEHYQRLLAGRPSAAGFESAGGGADLSDGGIDSRVETARSQLRQIVQQHLGDDASLYELADRIAVQGGGALRLFRDDQHAANLSANLRAGLEAIVRTDGTRPSFMVRNGKVDTTTSPLGRWARALDANTEALEKAIACVGRIDVPDSEIGFEGTGFLVQDNLILTNRHVLQMVADPGDGGKWQFRPNVSIDFGHEFRARESVTRRALKSVLFAGPTPIKLSGAVDHAKLDLALIEIENSPSAEPQPTLSVDLSVDWPQPDLIIFTVGYPANPGIDYSPTLLEQLFQSTFGAKRLAPGRIMKSNVTQQPWTLAHDATTLGGNSGSVVLVTGRAGAAAGLHYGGRRGEPRENWGHILGRVLDQTNTVDGHHLPNATDPAVTTLREQLHKFGVNLVEHGQGNGLG